MYNSSYVTGAISGLHNKISLSYQACKSSLIRSVSWLHRDRNAAEKQEKPAEALVDT